MTDGYSIQKVFDILLPYFKEQTAVNKLVLPEKGLTLKTLFRNIHYAFSHKSSNNINHITGASHYLAYALNPRHTVTTVHDFNQFIGVKRKSLKYFIFKLLFINPLKRNKYLICISETCKQQLKSLMDYPPNQIFVIGDPISEEYIFSPKQFNEEKPVVLHIGTKDNKNLIRTIKALENINCHLRIIGKLTNNQQNALDSSDIEYSNAFNLTEEALIREYKNCDIVNFVSLYEGFGMPIIEAQAIGRCCITSDIEPMLSVGGGGAIYVNPYDIESIRQGYLSIIHSSSIRERILSVGEKNAKKYSAESIANQYLNIYKLIN